MQICSEILNIIIIILVRKPFG